MKCILPKQKQFSNEDRVCHCFGHTKKAIEADFLANGRSLIQEKIVREKMAGGCRCTEMNPSGR